MDQNYALLQALSFALAGWIGCCYLIVHSQIKLETRRWLIVPLWFVWMAVALGGPVVNGVVSLVQASSTAGGVGFGMLIFTLAARRSRRSR